MFIQKFAQVERNVLAPLIVLHQTHSQWCQKQLFKSLRSLHLLSTKLKNNGEFIYLSNELQITGYHVKLGFLFMYLILKDKNQAKMHRCKVAYLPTLLSCRSAVSVSNFHSPPNTLSVSNYIYTLYVWEVFNTKPCDHSLSWSWPTHHRVVLIKKNEPWM